MSKYYSEHKQDHYLDTEIFKGKTNGIFVEVGAADGVKLSNTLFFETNRKWTGICIEPRQSQYQALRKNRSCICENCCISTIPGKEKFIEFFGAWLPMLSGIERNFHPIHKKKIDEGLKQEENYHSFKVTEVPSFTLQEILDKHRILKIDYCSIDTEGSDLEVLESIDFYKTSINVISIENNYREMKIKEFIEANGYRLVKEIGVPDIALDQIYLKH